MLGHLCVLLEKISIHIIACYLICPFIVEFGKDSIKRFCSLTLIVEKNQLSKKEQVIIICSLPWWIANASELQVFSQLNRRAGQPYSSSLTPPSPNHGPLPLHVESLSSHLLPTLSTPFQSHSGILNHFHIQIETKGTGTSELPLMTPSKHRA